MTPPAVEDRLASRVLHRAPIAIVVLHIDGRIDYVNPYFERLAGTTLADVEGRDWFDTFLPLRDRDAIRTLFRSSVHGDRVTAHVNAIVTRSGEERDIEWSDEFLLDEHGVATRVLAIGVDVTDRVRASRQLAASEALLRDAEAIAKLGSWELDVVGGHQTWSHEAYRIFEIDISEIDEVGSGTSYERFLAKVHPEDRQVVDAAYRGLVERHEPFAIAHRLSLPDGRIKWVQQRGRTFYDPSGQPLRSVGSVQDVTEQTLAAIALQESESRLRAIVASEPECVKIVNSDATLVDMNPAGLQLIGVETLDAVAGQRVTNFMTPRFRGLYQRGVDAVFNGEVTEQVFELVSFDGTHRWLEQRAAPLWDAARPGVVKHMLAVTRDITEKKRLEERLDQAASLARVGSWESRIGVGTGWWSDELFRILGFEPGSCRPAFETFIGCVHPDDRARVAGAYGRGSAAGTSYDLEHRLLLADGRVKQVRAQVRFVLGEDCLPIGARGTLQDISEVADAQLRLRNIVDAMSAVVVVLDLNGGVLDANRQSLVTLGLTWELVRGQTLETMGWLWNSPGDQAKGHHAFTRASTGDVVPVEVRVRRVGGAIVDLDLVFSPLRDASGRIEGVVVSGVDVTERRWAEASARRNADLLRAVVHGTPVVMFALDRHGVYELVEGNALAMVGVPPGRLVGRRVELVSRDVEGFAEDVGAALAGRASARVVRVRGAAFEYAITPRHNEAGEVDGVLGVGLDVTVRLASDAAIRDRDARLAAVFNHGRESMLLFTVAPDGVLRVAAVNLACLERIAAVRDVREADLIGLTFEALTLDVYGRSREILDGYLADIQHVLETRAPFAFEHAMEFPHGLIVAEVSLLPVLGPAGECAYLLWSSRDITAKRLADQQLRASLAEKETLLREVHHRVKNNLQVVSGLLHFHAKKLTDPANATVFRELRQRITAMTLVHERLYQSGDVAHVDFGQYLQALVAELRRSLEGRTLGDDRAGVEFVTDVEEVSLSIGQAVPSGLIISELVTNALKHAFPAGRRGRVTISARCHDGRVELRVDDDGVGFAPSADAPRTVAFGWELVRSLAKQLDATVDVQSDHGTHVRLSFERGSSGPHPTH